MKSKLILNPVSGTDSAPEFILRINEVIRQNFGELDISLTIEAGDAKKIAENSARDGNYDYIFVAGGDGTLNEVLNGVAQIEGALERITFGLIPLGTGNDFAAALGLPEDVEQTLDILKNRKTVEVDVGKVNNKFFVNVSAGGFIAEVSEAVNPTLKSFAGKLAYLLGGAQVLFDYEPIKTSARFIGEKSEDISIEREYNVEMFAVGNSRLIGGGRMITPDAIANDGLLDVCIIKEMTTVEFLNLLTYITSGGHTNDPRVDYFRVREIEMTFERQTRVNVDGEVFSTNFCQYTILPRAAKFLAGDAPFFT